jgi:flagellar biosynthesis GTPase FlhF
MFRNFKVASLALLLISSITTIAMHRINPLKKTTSMSKLNIDQGETKRSAESKEKNEAATQRLPAASSSSQTQIDWKYLAERLMQRRAAENAAAVLAGNNQNDGLPSSIHQECRLVQQANQPELPNVYNLNLDNQLMNAVLQDCPKEVRKVINLLQNRYRIEPSLIPKKLLFIGMPGTGKTTVANAIAAKCGMPCYMYKASPYS